jgi:YVTN family beta-propeller protein
VAYVLNTEAGSVSAIDGRAGRLLATLPVGDYPIGIALDAATDRAYVVNNRANTLSVLTEAPLAVVATRRIPRNVSSAALDPEAGLLYLALKGEDRVAVIRLRDL